MTRNSHKGFVSYDALFSILPVVFTVSFIIQMMAVTVSDASYAMEERANFNFLVATADYLVKVGGAKEVPPEAIAPNWIDSGKFEDVRDGLLANYTQLSSIELVELDSDQIPDNGTCIYRLVVVDDTKEIQKLYVCG